MPSIDEQMAVQAVRTASASLSLSLTPMGQTVGPGGLPRRLQTLHARARSLIHHNWSSGLLSALHSTFIKCLCSLCKAEGHCGRSKVLLLHRMEQLLSFWPISSLNAVTYLCFTMSFLSSTHVNSKVSYYKCTTKGATYKNLMVTVCNAEVHERVKEPAAILNWHQNIKWKTNEKYIYSIRYTTL